MMTVTRLARSCGLSRSTLLYYESIGLLGRPQRSSGNYRAYGASDARRLQEICLYRDAGLKLEDIRAILDSPDSATSSILARRLAELGTQIERLRGHQRSILQLMKQKSSFTGDEIMTKEKWVAIMKAAGFTEEQMDRWHKEFERAAPEEHQQFLESLHIPADEVKSIRKWSAQGA